jgi:CheY-like chemotaxis protein
MPKTVILIDDDQDDLDIVKETIQTIDDTIHCICFVHPDEALRMITNTPSVIPDYIFSDVNMPKIGGVELLSEIRKTSALNHTVIAMLSTSMPDSQSLRLKLAGADFAIEKPIKMQDYRATIETILQEKRTYLPHDYTPSETPLSLHAIEQRTKFWQLPLNVFNKENSPIYVIDYSWNYLFANPIAIQKIQGYDVVGKNITQVWSDLPQFNFQPVYSLLKENVVERKPIELINKSPVTDKYIKIIGQPLVDCYLFNISEVPEKDS